MHTAPSTRSSTANPDGRTDGARRQRGPRHGAARRDPVGSVTSQRCWQRSLDEAMATVVRRAIEELRQHPSVREAHQIAAMLERVPPATKALGLADVAEVLADRGRREEALALAGRGMAVAQAIGHTEAIARHNAVRRAVSATHARPVHGWASLTPAEWRVIGPVVRGLTYAEVGEDLSVSRRTVESHVAAVFRKVGVNNRRELVDAVQARHAQTLSLSAA